MRHITVGLSTPPRGRAQRVHLLVELTEAVGSQLVPDGVRSGEYLTVCGIRRAAKLYAPPGRSRGWGEVDGPVSCEKCLDLMGKGDVS